MALKRCKECGKEVSSKATACPGCGAPIKRKATASGCAGCLVFFVVAAIIAAFVLPGSEKPEKKGALSTKPKKTKHIPQNAGPKKKAAPEPDAPVEPKRSRQEIRYRTYAALYMLETKMQAKAAPVLNLRDESTLIGALTGAFQITQIIGPRAVIFDKLDSDGFPSSSVRVDGLSTAGQVDDENVTFGDRIFAFKGTWSYYTILGARRTIYRVEALNKRMLANAVAELEDEEEAAREAARQRHRERVQAAQAIVDRLRTASNTFEAENWRAAKYLRLTERVRMYEKHTTDPRMEKVWQKAKDELKDLGTVSPADIDAYRTKEKEYAQPLEEAKASLQAIVKDKPE